MWDIGAIHLMIDPEHGSSLEISAPTVLADTTFSTTANSGRTVTVITDIDPEVIFRSFWRDLESAEWLRDVAP